MSDRIAVFIDYQNVHLVAHELFAPYGKPVHETVVHPVKIAERIVSKRRGDNELVAVRVYRGRPNPEHQPTNTAANDGQKAAWEPHRRVTVVRRDLNYRGWPDEKPHEKGIDVALAVDYVRMSMLEECDVAILFSADRDLLPALEMAFQNTKPNTEIACWSGRATSPKPLWFPEYLPNGKYLPYCHFLKEEDWDACRDHTPYV